MNYILITVAVVVMLIALRVFYRKRKMKKQLKAFEKEFKVDLTDAKDLFYTNVVGVSKKNSDGSSRQKIIKKIQHSDVLKFIREPENEFDSKAIAVKTMSGLQVGYIRGENAATLAPQMDRGDVLFGIVKEVTGGNEGKYYGVNMTIYNGGRANE